MLYLLKVQEQTRDTPIGPAPLHIVLGEHNGQKWGVRGIEAKKEGDFPLEGM
jgi:hypothetical protein